MDEFLSRFGDEDRPLHTLTIADLDRFVAEKSASGRCTRDGAGLRGGEALRLTRADVDLSGALLTVRETKFYKSRLVPLGSHDNEVLTQYARRWLPYTAAAADDLPFLANRDGTPLVRSTVHQAFVAVRQAAGLQSPVGARRRPRLHDLRHSFAVHRLTSWYREGKDVQRLLPYLATCLGHTDIAGTTVYLSMTPELLHEASPGPPPRPPVSARAGWSAASCAFTLRDPSRRPGGPASISTSTAASPADSPWRARAATGTACPIPRRSVRVTVTAVRTPLIRPGSDLAVVSIAEGRLIGRAGDRAALHDLVRREAEYYLEPHVSRYDIMLTIKGNWMFVSAGIDQSNAAGQLAPWPRDPQRSTNHLWRRLRAHTAGERRLGVILADSGGIPLNWGVVGRGIAHCGFQALRDYTGTPDLHGRKFTMEKTNLVQSIAAAAVLRWARAPSAPRSRWWSTSAACNSRTASPPPPNSRPCASASKKTPTPPSSAPPPGSAAPAVHSAPLPGRGEEQARPVSRPRPGRRTRPSQTPAAEPVRRTQPSDPIRHRLLRGNPALVVVVFFADTFRRASSHAERNHSSGSNSVSIRQWSRRRDKLTRFRSAMSVRPPRAHPPGI